uniref:Uncharacterized protein n=1 Tax=Rhizophora mucronata TaxID=61149 RepID=A0A2P2QGU0_RHIMU
MCKNNTTKVTLWQVQNDTMLDVDDILFNFYFSVACVCY